MVVEQYPYEDEHGVKHDDLIKHYSDLGLKIQKVGTEEIYADGAVDVYPCIYEYIEIEETQESDTSVDLEQPIE